jgi:hypothetical protein
MSPPLERLELVMEPGEGPLLAQVKQALAEQVGANGEALRWAITGLASPAGATGRPRLSIEAVVLRLPL